MSTKTPVRATFTGSNVTGLAEYQSGEFIPLTHGGLGASLSIGSAGQVLKVNGAGSAIEFGAVEAIVNIDNATDLESATLAVGDKILLSDGGTEGRVLLSQLDTLFSGTTKTLTNKTLTSPAINNPTITGGTFSGTFTGTMDATGMVLSGASPLVFEGATADASETTLAFVDPTTDRTITFPNATGTIVLEATGSTLTNKSIDLGNNTISGSLAEFNTALQDDSFAGLAATQTLTNKTLTSAVLNTGVSGSAILDEDDLSSNSATQLATQQSIKAYVDAISTTLTLAADSGSNDGVVVGTDTLTFAGGTGIDSTVSNNQISYAIDSTVATLTGTQTLTNKTLTSPTITGTGAIAGTFTGNITGDVTGNANTATALATARNIGGVSFDGSANINLPGVNASGNQDTSGNAATATVLETARTIAGQSFNGSANITIASTDLSNTAAIALLTASQTLTNKTLTTPVIAEIDATADFTIDAAGDINLDAGGADINLKDDGTKFAIFSNDNSNLSIKSDIQDKDIVFKGDDNGSVITALTLDMSEAGAASFNSNVTVGGNAVITGNLTVNGTTTTLATTNSTITDRLIELGNGTTGTPGNDMGIVMERGDSNNAFMGWDESTDKFIVGTGTFTGASTGDLTITTGTLVANLEGNVTGNVTGNVSGTSGSTTGNAATATALQNARTIHGVSFDGTANIDLTEVVQDTVGAMFSSNTETGITVSYQDGDGTIDLVVGTLNQDTTGNAATATALETARTIAGQSFDGSANITIASTDLSNTSNITLNDASQTLTNKTLTSPVIAAITSTADIDLTATDDVNIPANVGLTFGNDGEKIEGNGTFLKIISSQNIEFDAAGVLIFDAGSGSSGVQFKDDGTEFLRFSSNGIHTDLYLPQEDGDFSIKLNDGGSTVTALTFDSSLQANAHFSNNVSIGGTFTFEGATADGHETTLTVVDPTADRTITFQNGSGTVAFLTDVTGGSTPGNFTTITLDNNITFEGATADAHETTLTVEDPTADRTVTIPDATGQIVLRDTTDTLTNKTLTSPVIAAITSTADIDLTATNDVNIPANVGMTFGDDGEKIEGDGTNLTISSSGKTIIDSTGDIELDAASGVIDFIGSGTVYGNVAVATNDLVIKSRISDGDMSFRGNDGGSEVVALTLDMSAAGAATFNSNVAIGGNATVTGNLTVNGTTTTLATTNSVISDRLIELGNGTTGTPGNDMGIVLERGDSDNAFIGFDESTDKFIVGTGTFTGASTGNLTITTGTLVANLEGAVTGNASTATALANARTIAGQSFDGTGNITIASTDLSNTSAIALLTSSQTLTNKTIDLGDNTLTGSLAEFNTALQGDSFVSLTGSETLTNKTLTTPTINGATFGAADVNFDSGTLFVDESTDRVGIGTTSPTQALTISGGNNAKIAFTGGGFQSIYYGDSGNATAGFVHYDHSSDNYQIDVSATITLDAPTSIKLSDSGTQFGQFEDSSNDFVISSVVSDKDLIFKGNDGGSTITALTLDMSGAGAATFNSTVTASGFVGDVTGDVTGNADTATTLATARTIAGQSFDGSANITIASTDLSNTSAITLLTSTQTLTNKTLTTPTIEEIDGSTITLDSAGDINLDADGGDVILKDGGTEFGRFTNNSTDLEIKVSTQDKDIKFIGDDGGSAVTALTLDMSDAGTATFNAGANFGAKIDVDNGTGRSSFDTTGNTTALRTRAGGVEGVAIGSEGGVGHAVINMRGQTALVGGNSSKGLSIGLGSSHSTVPASTGSIHLNGNVGIGTGTSDPTAPLEIKTTATTDTLLLTSTEASSTASPVLTLKRNSGSVADADYLGQLKFKGENDNDEEITYAKVTGKILDASDGTEDGLLEFSNIKAGSQVITARLRSDSLQLLNGTSLSVAGDATITGDLTVNGTTTTVSTTNTVVSDSLLELGNGTSGSPSNDAGLVIERGDSDNAFIGYDESDDKFKVGTGSFTGASTGNLTVTTGTLVANLEGNVTGNVTGNVSGTAGSATGNAATATALESARTIGGVSFDGTANINLPGVNTSGSQDTSGNAATATILANARTIAGQSFNGSANITIASSDLSDTASIATLTGSQTLTNKSIDSDNNTITNIVNADIKSSAAIAFSKMADLTASRALASDSNGDVSVTSVTATELGYLDGVSSAIQTQLDAKQATIDSSNRLNANLINDGTVDNTEFGYLNGVTSAIQTQIDNKATKGFAVAMAIAL